MIDEAERIVDKSVEVERILSEDEDRRQRILEYAAPYVLGCGIDGERTMYEVFEFFWYLECWLRDGSAPKAPPPPENPRNKFKVVP